MKNLNIYIITAVLICFIILDNIITIIPIVRNIIYGIMAVIGIAHLIINKNSNGINNIFKKNEDEIKDKDHQ
jgi:hypothetical protein